MQGNNILHGLFGGAGLCGSGGGCQRGRPQREQGDDPPRGLPLQDPQRQDGGQVQPGKPMLRQTSSGEFRLLESSLQIGCMVEYIGTLPVSVVSDQWHGLKSRLTQQQRNRTLSCCSRNKAIWLQACLL